MSLPRLRPEQLTVESIRRSLQRFGGQEMREPYPAGLLEGPPRPAAVLVPLLRENGDWRLLFIRRTQVAGDMHSGQVAFPGGGSETGDASLEATALREANEEIGLHARDVHILGRMGTFLTISNFLVTPVVAVITWPAALSLSPAEVGRVFTIPLSWLYNPVNYQIRERKLPPPYPPLGVIHYNPYDGEILWGATARITHNFLEALAQGQAAG
jgi:8-oxo-dGTP pyrophosphatase MutT (NUDIX family)